MSRQRTLLIISQVFPPDPTSLGQHIADVAAEMVRRGWRVVVLTSARGYDDPTQKYPSRETMFGSVDVRRLPLASFGKKSIPIRLFGAASFILQVILRGLFLRGLDTILVSTSPPMASLAAVFISKVRRRPVKYWLMDLNPDQVIELGKVKPDSLAVRGFEWINRRIFGQASDIVVLDRFMAARVLKKMDVKDKMTILPPWPMEDYPAPPSPETNPFRLKHNLQGKFVIMYSGNHGFSTPVTTILQAALRMQDVKDLVFMFIGGGVGKKEVEQVIAEHKPTNIISLPYQPLSELLYSLSAADVHVVTVGNQVVGVVHPCKVYGAMAVHRPILLVGPDPSHVSDIIRDHNIGWHVSQGDVDGAVQTIRQILQTPREQLDYMGKKANEVVGSQFSRAKLRAEFCDILARGR
jgi:colanic acid biosynthesis glycosyl transferase WcaI